MDGAQVGVFEKTDQVGLSGFLESKDSRTLETKIGLEVLGDLTNKALEGQLADEEVSGLLVTTDLTKSDGSRSVTVGLLHTSGGGGRLTSRLGGKLLTRSLSSGTLTSGLLGTSHVWIGLQNRFNLRSFEL
jgi:histone H3